MRTGRNVLCTWDSRLLASGRKLAIFLDPSRSPSLVVAGLLEEIKGLDEERLSCQGTLSNNDKATKSEGRE
ncbi:hypothetical protein C8J56DRAFT_1030188 [Mycena floridula]|nr:hypothetical protein C8J56DRAFT_1030188 [Mycena floridula]